MSLALFDIPVYLSNYNCCNDQSMYTVFSGPVVLCIAVCIGKTINTGSVLVVTITCKELCKSQSYSGEKLFLLNY